MTNVISLGCGKAANRCSRKAKHKFDATCKRLSGFSGNDDRASHRAFPNSAWQFQAVPAP
jgi:hypothetical protein